MPENMKHIDWLHEFFANWAVVTYCFIQLVFLLKDLSFPKEGLLVVWLNSQNLLLGHFSCVEKVTFNHLTYACQGCVPSRKFHLCLDTKVTYEYNFWINARYENNLKSYKQLQWISHKINPDQAPVPCCWRSSLYPLTIVGYLLATGTWQIHVFWEWHKIALKCHDTTMSKPVNRHLHVLLNLLVI